MAKEIIFTLKVGGGKESADRIARLTKEVTRLNTAIKGLDKNDNKGFLKLNSQLIETKIQIGEARKEIRQAVKDFNKVEFPANSILGIADAFAKVQRQIKVTADTDPEFKRLSDESDKLAKSLRLIKFRADQVPTDSILGMKRAFSELERQIERTSKRDPKFADLTKKSRALKDEIRDLSLAYGNSVPNIGNYNKGLLKLTDVITGGLLTGGLFILGNAIKTVFKDAARIVKEFDDATAELASVTLLDRESEDFTTLIDNARTLGQVTAFTATEVLQLELSLAKLGFSPANIIPATRAVEDLAIATGVKAGRAATLAGAALRAFGLRAAEMSRVASTLAVATTRSALTFQKLEVALTIVQPVASATNVSLERTTALLGVLTNRGVEASIAGTSLRNIFTRLAVAGLTWEEGMERINSATDKNIAAFQLFGIRGQAAALILADSAPEVDKLEKSITGADEALRKMTDERLNSISGRALLFKSAWAELVLSIEDGNGIFATTIRTLLDLGTILIKLVDGFDSITDALRIPEGVSLFEFIPGLQGFSGAVSRITKASEEEAAAAAAALLNRQKAFSEWVLVLRRGGQSVEQVVNTTGGAIADVQAIFDQAAKAARGITDEIGGSFQKLLDLQSELRSDAQDLLAKGIDASGTIREYEAITKRVEAIQKRFQKGSKKSRDDAKAEAGSIRDLKNELAALELQLSQTSDVNKIADKIDAILDKKEEIEELQKTIDDLNFVASGIRDIGKLTRGGPILPEDVEEDFGGELEGPQRFPALDSFFGQDPDLQIEGSEEARFAGESAENFRELNRLIIEQNNESNLELREQNLLFIEQRISDEELEVNERIKLQEKLFKARVKLGQEAEKAARKQAKDFVNALGTLTNVLAEFAVNGEKTLEESLKKQGLLLLKAVEAQVDALLVQVLARETANFGLGGFATSAIILTAVKLALATARAGINSFAEGGIVQPRPAVNGVITGPTNLSGQHRGDNVLIKAKPGEAIINEYQQRIIGHDVLGFAGVPGFADGGLIDPSPVTVLSPNISSNQNLTIQFTDDQFEALAQQNAALSASAAALIAAQTGEALESAIGKTNRKKEQLDRVRKLNP